MNEYDNIIQSYTELAPAKATTALDADPDKAARALQLSRATGVAPLVINADQDRFEEDHRADMTAGIIRRNSQIAAYIRGNDLADHVSNDDYGNLDNASRAFSDTLDSHPIWGKGIPKRYIAEPLMEGLKGALYGIGEGLTQSPLKIPENYIPASKWAYEALGLPLRGLNAVAGGFMGGAGGLARQAVLAAGGDENSATRAEREARGVVESEMGRGGGGLPHDISNLNTALLNMPKEQRAPALKMIEDATKKIAEQQEAMALAKPWLDAGVDVPRGVHPLIDQIKEKTNDAWVDKIQNALQEAQNSTTRERDPELFKNFAQQHFADAQMGISADAVIRLYGDKLPSREDGILGWVPGIEEKLEAAKTFGEDVHVPLADWVTYVDPQLASELKPDLRAWPGGITKNEAAVKDLAAPAIDGALPQVRTSAALEPMFAIGDRPLKLEKGESIWKGMEDYNFVDHTGKVVGEITIFPDPMKKQLYIASVSSHDLQPNTMGPSLIRDIKRQLKELYPEYETISGYRISGAREEAGAPKEQRKPVVKLALGDAFELSKEYTDLRRILETSPTKFGDVTADLVPKELWTTHERAIGQAVQEEINRITGKTAEPVLASDLRYEGIDGIRGVYHQAPGEIAKILVNMHDFDATGIARHEAIHHLYREGFFKPEEWNSLIEASKAEGWIDRYGIAGRYDHLNELGQHEEAIAEAFRDWAKTREQQPVTPVTTIFQKLWDLMQRIKDRVAKILGREPTFNELFEQAYSGELAKRELAERSREKIQTDLGENVPGALFSVAEEPTKKGFVAYHGSPYEFDKFDASKIGTGEGAQAYGHGLYFAEKKGIAEHYRDSVSKSRAAEDEIWIGGKPFNPDDPIHQAAGRLHEYDYNRNQTIYFLDGLIDDFEKSLSNKKDHWLAVTKQAREILASGVELPKVTEHSPGSLYQVRIDADPAHFLDWDKPLSEQKWIWDKLPEDLKAAIVDAMDARGHNPMSEVLEEYTGKDLYRALTQHEIHESIPAELPGSSWYEGNTTEKIHTAKFFESLGVEGIQYLDAGSRRKGDGSRNYVVFNGKNVEITHKNGKPVNEPPPFAKGGEPPPVEEGKIRYYHGTAFENAKDFEGKTFLTPQYEYARNYRGGPNNVFYTDFTREEAIQRGLYDEINNFPKIGSIDDGAARLMPHTIKESAETKVEPTAKQKEELQTQLKAEAAGLDAKHKKKIDKLINQEYKENLEAAMKRAEAEQKTLQSKEWKDAAKEIRKEVDADIRQRPDVAADLLIGSGELGRKQLERKNYPLRAEDLTAEQKASLPRRYYSKDGIPVDIMANLFGFTSGDRLVEELSSYTKSREGMSAQEGLRKTIDEEVQRRMEEKFGKLQDNIMLEAMDQAFSETALNRLAEEWQGAAMQAGIQVIDKNVAKEEALRIFNKRTLKEINPEHLIGIMGKLGRDAERAAIDQRWNDMSVLMQRKYMTGLIVAEARKLQKEQLIFDRTIRPYRKQFDPSKSMNIDPEWGLFIRDFLGKIDRPNGMTRLGLEQRIADSRFKDFADFVNKTENENQLMGLEFPIDEKYLDPNYGKPTDQMTAGEFREVRNLVNFMDKMGKTFHQAEVAGKTIQRGDWLAQAREQLSEKFDSVNISKSETKNAVSRFIVASTNIETLFGRFDGRDKHGLFTETFVYPAFRADNFEAAKQKEIAKAYKELGQIENSQRTLPSIFRDPLNNNELLKDVTRANLAVVISNMGNDYTFNRLARGWGIEPEILWDWVKQHSTVADLERAAKMGKIFEGLWKESATMYRSLYTFAPEAVVPRPFEMHGRRWDGWYHPVIGDSHRSRFVNKLPEMEDYGFWPSVSNGYTKRRTGADQVIDLTYEAIPNRMSQMIHDIAFRPFITETVKLIKDNSFRQMITQYYGKDSMQQIDGWFLRLAGEKSYQTDAMRQAIKISNNIRQNVISTQIAFNLGTVQKHGTTAWLMSAREMGPNLFKTVPKFIADTAIIGVDKIAHEIGLDKYRKAVWETFGNSYAVGDSIWDFVHTNFEEIQRRERQIYDTIGGQHQIITDEKTPWREYVSHYGAKLVSFSDKMSAVPLAWAKYQELRGMGESHGAAVDIASAAVRRAHGSVGRANLPGIVTSVNPVTPWLTSIYGFMGTSMQRRIEIFHDINDAFKLGREGEIREAANKIPAILSSIAVYIVWTGFIEETVSSQFTDDRRGLGEKTLSHLFGWTSNAILGMRDLYHNIEYGKESAGLIGTPIHDVLNFGHDIKKAIHNGRIERGEGSKMLQHGLTAIGDLYGVAPKHLAAPIRYGIDVFSGYQKPKSTGDVYRGLMTGKQELYIRR